ncbi:MAG: PA14 domain-containing protein [Myxococcota bacterium]
MLCSCRDVPIFLGTCAWLAGLLAVVLPVPAAAQYLAELYDDITLTTKVAERSHAVIDFDWGTGEIDPAVGSDNASIRWTGNLQASYDETYTFYATTDDGVRLWVDGVLVIDDWTVHPAQEFSANVALSAGQIVPVVMEFYEQAGHAVARLEWASPSQARTTPAALPIDPPGFDALVPVDPFFNGVFPSTTPGPGGIEAQAVSANLGVGLILTLTRGDGVMYAGSRNGEIVEIVPGSTSETGTLFLDITDRVWTGQDSGLLGMAFHPDYDDPVSANRNYLYLYYVHSDGSDEFIRLSRFERPDGQSTASPGSELILLQQKLGPTLHRGGGLLFGNDGYLYLSIGDLGWPNESQEIDDLFVGGVLRIDVDQGASSHPIPRQPDPADPSTFTQNYTIPDDNPFVGVTGVLEEYYSLGSRNPHRMTIDPETGVIVIGNVGSNMASSVEELNVLVAGANYGWPFREGYADIGTPPASPIGVVTDPVLTYPRAEGACIIGGHVYRGSSIPSLQGRYIFGDCTNNNVWAAQDASGNGPKQLITTAPAQLVTFGRDDAGEVYLGTASSVLYRLAPSTIVPEPPALLSQTGVFSDLTSLTIDPAFIPYEVINPLWSDGSLKRRWFAVPNGNGNNDRIQYSETSEWGFPSGSVFVKHFEIPVAGAPARRVETRVLAQGTDGQLWGVTYRWRPDGLEADLLSDGMEEMIEGQLWQYPSRTECNLCHNPVAGGVLGLRTSQQNAELFYPSTGRTAHQLETFDHVGLLVPGLGGATPDDLPALSALDDLTAFTQQRVRSYLQSNCAQCHRPGGQGRGDFDTRYETPFAQQDLLNTDVAEDLGVTGAKVVVPGDVLLSALFHRDALLGTSQMPPLAKNVVDFAWLAVLRDWIGVVNEPPVAPLSGDYYDGRNFDTFVFQRDDVVIDFDWGGGTPDASVGNDEFSIRWTGTLIPEFSETYTFTATSDDGVRVFVDGTLVVDDWSVHAAREASGTIALVAGQAVPFVVEYYEAGGRAVIQVDWESASLPRTPVTASLPNTAPSATPQAINVASGVPLAIALGGSDAEQSTLDVAIVDPPSAGTLIGTGPVLFYTSAPGYTGSDSFTFKTSDGALESAPATVALTVPEPTGPWALFAGALLVLGLRARRGRRR